MTKNDRRKLKIDGVKAIFNDKCVDCGWDDQYEILEFHHVIPRCITKRPSMKDCRDWKWTRFRDEMLAECVLLCPTCHSLRHYREVKDDLRTRG